MNRGSSNAPICAIITKVALNEERILEAGLLRRGTYLCYIQLLNKRYHRPLIFIILTIFFQRKSAWCAIPFASLYMSACYLLLVSILRLARFRAISFLKLPNLDCWGCILKATVVPG